MATQIRQTGRPGAQPAPWLTLALAAAGATPGVAAVNLLSGPYVQAVTSNNITVLAECEARGAITVEDILGADQTITYTNPPMANPVFFRARVWLQPQ